MSDGLDGFIWEHWMASMGDFLTDEEKELVVVMRLAGMAMDASDDSDLDMMDLIGEQVCPEEEAEALVDWARGARIDATMLSLVIEGKLVIAGIEDGEPSFRLSPKGEEWARKLAEDAGVPLPEQMKRDWGPGA